MVFLAIIIGPPDIFTHFFLCPLRLFRPAHDSLISGRRRGKRFFYELPVGISSTSSFGPSADGPKELVDEIPTGSS